MYSKSFVVVLFLIIISCKSREEFNSLSYSKNVIDYTGTPKNFDDRSVLAFSDQGAWFGYGFPDSNDFYAGFTGPFLMTQENGVWLSKSFSYLEILNKDNNQIDLEFYRKIRESFNSHLLQELLSDSLKINQLLFFDSPHTAQIKYEIKNITSHDIKITPKIRGDLWLKNVSMNNSEEGIKLISEVSDAVGLISLSSKRNYNFQVKGTSYIFSYDESILKSGEIFEIFINHSFLWPEYNKEELLSTNKNITEAFNKKLLKRQYEKELELKEIIDKTNERFSNEIYRRVIAKSVLTLQNNWRVAAGELKHEGLFPSYNYKWFHGFWAWDSWKHSAALALYNSEIAENQIRAMFDFQEPNGFIADCVYRDTTIEKHNYRNTKPPLSAWAVNKVFEESHDTTFVREMFPKIVSQHNWWYSDRDYDKDSLCEYGSTDGSLIAAKWESGMDNAVRFDSSNILKISNSAYSLNQESVDLNSYLYLEKLLLYKFSKMLALENSSKYLSEASSLKQKIQKQFFDDSRGWFFDTSIDGKEFIGDYGCEGWIPLFTNVVSDDQAKAVCAIMLDENHFNTLVPLQTLTASSKKFNPDGGYWRGPNWLDQAYFGIRGLLNYRFNSEAEMFTEKIINNGEGIATIGEPIRENYNPINGDGLEARSFSWSAAHLILLLTDKDF